jgi:hypothetical protein
MLAPPTNLLLVPLLHYCCCNAAALALKHPTVHDQKMMSACSGSLPGLPCCSCVTAAAAALLPLLLL